MMCAENRKEQSLRRLLKEAGYMMRKSSGPITSNNLGGYMIVERSGNTVVAGSCFELAMEDVEEWARDML